MFVSLALLVGSFGVPRFRDAVERSKAGEAFHYLNVVRVAEARHHARFGSYTEDVASAQILCGRGVGTRRYRSRKFLADDLDPKRPGGRLRGLYRVVLRTRI